MSEIETALSLKLLVIGSCALFVLTVFFIVLIAVFIHKFKKKQAELLSAVLESQEKERKRIGSDLHDEIGPLLSAAKIQLELLKSEKGIDESNVTELQELLDAIFTGIRISVQSLVPTTLYHYGLVIAVKELCNKLNTAECKIEFSGDVTMKVPIPAQLNMYRIIQELLNNSVKHAHSSQIKLAFRQSETVFSINVSDNGIGLNSNKDLLTAGIGLKNIKSRVSVLNGKMIIKSAINQGTFVQVRIPKESLLP